MNVVFLDIDGVLNCSSSESRTPCGYIGIDGGKVRLLKKIVTAANAVIVLTSTWKKEWDHSPDNCTEDGLYLTKKLSRQGLRILAKTQDQIYDRGRGIREWIDKRSDCIESWVVLDDFLFADFETFGITPKLVQSDPEFGLTEELAEKAISILKT